MTSEDVDALRTRRRALLAQDDAISYVRRVAQARGDLARAALARRGGAAPAVSPDVPAPPAPEANDDVASGLRDVLSPRLIGDAARPPRPVEDHSGDPRAAALDEICAQHGFGRLDELDADELARLVAALDAFEKDVSTERQALHAELDTLTEELVDRLHDAHGEPGVDR